jgi:hypothetical protein
MFLKFFSLLDQSIFEEIGVVLSKDPGVKLMTNAGELFKNICQK